LKVQNKFEYKKTFAHLYLCNFGINRFTAKIPFKMVAFLRVAVARKNATI